MATTASMSISNGILVTIPNKTDDVDTGSPHWYISYNNRDNQTYGSDTTALVLGQMEYFFILNGDHRQAFKDCIQAGLPPVGKAKSGQLTGLGRCLNYVREHKAELNSFSDPLI